VSYNQSNAVHNSIAQITPLRRDEQLVLAAQAGSSSAFTELLNLYSRRVYKTILSITKNKEDAEDALQDCFLKAYLAVNRFEGRASFYSWLTRIAINCSLMSLRKRRMRLESSLDVPLEQGEIAFPMIRDTAPNPEQLYEQGQRYLKLVRAIGRLTPTLREVIETRGLEECSVRETAHLLAISEAATKSRLYRARTRLIATQSQGNLSRRNFA
jgi:RNA polymerase sigma-70 factor, ECF subfamily